MFKSVVACLVLSVADARSSAVNPNQQKLSPPLTDVKSDKKFFGPPFPADYPDDKRPAADKNLLDKIKGPGMPYPALQSKDDYDRDYVKDENSDKGDWEAQFEYDRLRRKLAQEEADARRAQNRADQEGRDADGAQRDDDAAGKDVNDAQNGVNDAAHGEDDIKKAEDFDGPPSDEKLKEIRKAIEDAEKRYAQAQKNFEECKRQLEAAKKELDDLKVQHKEMEEKLAADTKLWAEQKTVKMNMRKTRQTEATAKVQAAKDKLAAAEKVKAEMDAKLAIQKAEHEKAKQALQKVKDEHVKISKKVDAAAVRLQKIHGYTPAQAGPDSMKSGASMASMFLALPIIMAFRFF